MPTIRLAVLVLASVLGARGARAADRAISGQTLKIKTDGARSQIVFTSKDPAFLFPGPGDDPATGGAVIEIIPATVAGATLSLPAGTGKPGWTVKTTGTPSYTFANSDAPSGISVAKSAALKQGKGVKFFARTGIPAPGALGAVAVRITTGSTRNCALFGPGTITRDANGLFSAKKAPAPAIADCSDASLGVPNCDVGPAPACGGACAGDGVCTANGATCTCVSPSAPCGETFPTCNGVCPLGEECLDGTSAFTGCGCVPIGSTACGDATTPVCGGSCVAGEACEHPGGSCACFPDGICNCPSGFGCTLSPPAFSCVPDTCAGSYPTCGGTCGDGGVCRPARSGAGGSTTSCVCAAPGPCDAACGGMDCPPGQVCQASIGACGCVAP
jgi:hypothetical protein